METFAESVARGSASQLTTVRRGEIGNLQFAPRAFGKRSTMRQIRSRLCSFSPMILRTRLRSPIPCLQDQAAVPFGDAPLIRNQKQRLFAGIEHGGLHGGGDEVFEQTLEIGGRHALSSLAARGESSSSPWTAGL